MGPVTKPRLSPFVSSHTKADGVQIRTPDHELLLAPRLAPYLRDLTALDSHSLEVLCHWGVALKSANSVHRSLYKLESYFKEESIDIVLVRKGAHSESARMVEFAYRALTADGQDACGVDLVREKAMLKAAAEMYERLSCNSRFNAVAIDDHIDMNLPSPEMVRFAEWQYAQPDFPYSRTVSKNWTRGGDPISGNAARFPSQLVFFLNESSSEPTCGQVTSNGVATHTIQGKALLASAYELIERDALMIHWFNRIPRESISAPSHLAGRIAHLEDLGFSVRLINLSLDVGPVILAVLRRRTCGFPGIALGLGAHPSPLIAATKALDEASLTTTALDDPVPSLCSPREVISIFDHQLWYSQPENQHELDFFESGIMVPIEAIAFGPRTVRELRSVFTRNGLQWYVVEMNSDGRRRTGLWTFRSVVPGLIPITFGYGLEPLGMSRLWEVPSRLGFKTNGYRISQGGYRVQPFS